MRRSLFISLLLSFFCWSVPAGSANAAEEHLISVILPNALPRYQQIQAAFLPALQSVCGAQCRVYVQSPNTDVLSLRNSIRKAVALDSRMIITFGTAATTAAKVENPSLPVLFVDVLDPEAQGFGGGKDGKGKHMMTGVRGDAPLPTLFRYFVEATGARRLAVLYEMETPEGIYQKEALLQAGARMNVEIVELAVGLNDDVVTVVKSMPTGTDGLFLAHGERLSAQAVDVVAIARQRRLPVISQIPGVAELGAFMTLETDPIEQGEQLAALVGQVLSARKVSTLDIVRPRQVAFIINLKTAQALNLKVPLQSLTAATRIIR